MGIFDYSAAQLGKGASTLPGGVATSPAQLQSTLPATDKTTLPGEDISAQIDAQNAATAKANAAAAAALAAKNAQANPLLASLSSLDTILGNKNSASTAEHDTAINGYNAQDALDHQAIDQNTNQNETNYTAGDQAALLNAANASTGLRGVLASLHALGGSGINIVQKLVGLAANNDTGAARGTFNNNATAISQAAAQTTQQEAQRRADADALLSNNLQNNQADVLNSKQSIFQQLANLFGSGTSQGDDYASKAAALAAPIAATTRTAVAPYAAASSLYSPASLASYLGGTSNLNVSTDGSAGTPTAINAPGYTAPTKKQDTLAGVA